MPKDESEQKAISSDENEESKEEPEHSYGW